MVYREGTYKSLHRSLLNHFSLCSVDSFFMLSQLKWPLSKCFLSMRFCHNFLTVKVTEENVSEIDDNKCLWNADTGSHNVSKDIPCFLPCYSLWWQRYKTGQTRAWQTQQYGMYGTSGSSDYPFFITQTPTSLWMNVCFHFVGNLLSRDRALTLTHTIHSNQTRQIWNKNIGCMWCTVQLCLEYAGVHW